jgi:hypothetical protein
MLGNVPVQVSVSQFVSQDLLCQSGFANLAGSGHKDHLPLEVFFDLRSQVAFHASSVLPFSTVVKETREVF